VSSTFDLVAAARREMVRQGFEPDFPPAAAREVATLSAELPSWGADTRDLRQLLWSSIDNPESRDLDQVEFVEELPNGDVRVRLGIADVDSRVHDGSPTDAHAGHNTTSVYCGVITFPMLPERLSTDLTSLNEGVDRLAMVTEFVVSEDGTTHSGTVYRAVLHNHAKLDYPSLGAWLENRGPAPAKVAASSELQQQLRLQDRVAQALRTKRHEAGALELATIEATPVAQNGQVTDLELHHKSRATELIEDFMIAANTTMALFLDSRGSDSIRRVVKTPARWDRIVAIAAGLGETLPGAPSSRALAEFLAKRRTVDPDHFPDLSLTVVKLLGSGEYTVQSAGQKGEGHFGLATQDYAHSTAPNRRYADLITQRLLKNVLAGKPPAYSTPALAAIATRCTQMEDLAQKVERTARKQAAAELLAQRIGQSFKAIVTGASAKGTFVRTVSPPAEGMLVQGERGVDVGDHLTVKLVATNPPRGFIDFARG
jgi:exoribonuclease-2